MIPVAWYKVQASAGISFEQSISYTMHSGRIRNYAVVQLAALEAQTRPMVITLLVMPVELSCVSMSHVTISNHVLYMLRSQPEKQHTRDPETVSG